MVRAGKGLPRSPKPANGAAGRPLCRDSVTDCPPCADLGLITSMLYVPEITVCGRQFSYGLCPKMATVNVDNCINPF